MIATKVIQLPKTTHTLVEDGIIKIDGYEGEHIELADAVKMREANLKLSEGKSFCLIMNGLTNYYTYSTEAKELFASKEYCVLRKATAFVVKQLSFRLMAAFYIKFHKPLSPTQIFGSEEEALIWLRKFK